MIGWLKGEKVEIWEQFSKHGVLLDCGGVGYEVHMTPRCLDKVKDYRILSLWIHQVQREDEAQLYGFLEKSDRNLFRVLIGVNGVGPKIALALFNELN